jgi:hypothetical protein
MLTVHVEKIVPTRDSLRLGLVVRYGEGGPVRFAQAVIEDDVLDWSTLSALAEYVVRQTNRHLDRERELLEEEDAGLFEL